MHIILLEIGKLKYSMTPLEYPVAIISIRW